MDFDWHSLMVGGEPVDGTARQKASGDQQHHLTVGPVPHSMVASTSSLPPSRPARPMSSSSFPSIASSPGPIRHHSSPPQQPQLPRSSQKNLRNRRVDMDVKVLYTLDSHPNSTLVANLGRTVSVQIVTLGKKESKGRSVLFGKIPLKTCLGAICMASPELMIDRRQDYILYSVDPIESYRASQRGAGPPAASSGSTSSRQSEAAAGSSERDRTKSRDGKVSSASSAYVVGKGFFTWALAEEGEGQSLVNGRVRDEYADEDEDDSVDGDGADELTGKILEVSLRLRAASGMSRDQYFDRVKAFQSSSAPSSFAAAQPEAPAIELHPETSTQPARSKRRSDYKHDNRQPHSASSPVTAVEKEQSQAATAATSNNPAQQQLLQFLQALQAASATSPQDTSLMPDHKLQQQARHFQQKPGASPDVMSTMLRSLAAPSPNASLTDRSPRVGGTTPLPAGTLSSTPRVGITSLPSDSKGAARLPDSAASPILGGLTPGYDASYLSGASPEGSNKATLSAENGNVKAEGQESLSGSASKHRPVVSSRSKQCCYNCGVRSQRSWRHLPLVKEDSVRFKDGSVVWDHGKKLYRACNACGLYFNKYSGIDRPEHVWKEAQRVKQEQHIKEHEEKGHGATCGCFKSGEESSNAEQGSATNPALSRTKQIARTLSEACERDMTRRISSCNGDNESDQEATVGTAPPRRMANFEEARLKDYVQDSEGTWRTKRSIMENPDNKRPGRPKGSKTGQGQGRPRERRLRNKRLQKQQEMMMQQLGSQTQGHSVAASSPGAGKAKHTSFAGHAIHSSPVRPSMVAGMAKTPGSAVSRIRYGAANYLLDSSPATAFQTVLNEAETDWNALCGLSPRRSPRKHPHGTQGGLNPYATVATSPSQSKPLPPGSMSTNDLLKLTSSSPLTRGRVKSGQYQLDESWFSSEGLDFNLGDDEREKKTGSSSLTSPGSPSPSPAHLKHQGSKRKHEGETMLQPGQRPVLKRQRSQQGGPMDAPQSAERARKAARQARQAASAIGPSDSSSVSMDAAAAAAAAGPFMGLDVNTLNVPSSLEEEEEEEAGRGSPTLGRSQRMGRKLSANGELGSLSMHTSPTSAMMDFQQDWTRNTSMRELFPTPSPIKQWASMNPQSPSNALWQSPTSWALKGLAASPSKNGTDEHGTTMDRKEQQQHKALKPLDQNLQQQQQQQQSQGQSEGAQQEQQLVRRKPLPATVEDASSSVNSASSSPRDDEDALEEVGSGNLMDLFEDPYGLLAASGIGVQGNQPGLSMEDFESIELFKTVDFSQQLDFFTQMGSNGVAAHIAPDQGSSSASTSTLKIEGRGVGHDVIAPNSFPTAVPAPSSTIDFATLLKDPSMQALLAHMQQSPSKQRQQITSGQSPQKEQHSVSASSSTG